MLSLFFEVRLRRSQRLRMKNKSFSLDHNPAEDSGHNNIGFTKDDEKPEGWNVTGNGNDLKKPEKSEIDISDTVDDGSPEGREVQWDSQLEFLLSCISMSVGLGNVWRFPFTAYENGGGTFLIPYLVVLFLIGKPIYFLEMAMGQFCSEGQVKVWRMVPILKGVGIGAAVGTACLVSYYCSLMAITIYYFFASFAKILPWKECDPEWSDQLICNGTEVDSSINATVSELYYGYVFPQKENVDDGIGTPQWQMTLCLVAAWILVFLSLIKGVQSSGKVAYFTAIFPYIVLFILLIRGVTLEGAWDGIEVFLVPSDWSLLLEPSIWYAAVGQCFFSLATGFGPIIMFASYNPFRHNVYRDAFIISLMDTFTSLLAGITVFAILGSLAKQTGRDVKDVVQDGVGLAFISYPDAIANFSGSWVPQLFAVLFFLMLFTLGVGSATSLTGGLITIISDQWPSVKRWMVTVVVCVVGCLVGLIYVTPGGQFMLTLVDYFGSNFVIYIMATFELIGIAWIYGLNSFCKDIEFMLEIKIGWYWKFCWGFFIPVALTAILLYSQITADPLTHKKIEFPSAAIACGWTLSAIAIASIPLGAAHAIYNQKGEGFVEKFMQSLKPSVKWGPKNGKVKEAWIEFKEKTA